MVMNETEPQPSVDPQRDIDRVRADQWPTRDFPLQRTESDPRVPVVIKQSVLDEIHLHGKIRTDVEICGVLVGNGYRDAAGPFVYVEASIRGEHAGHQMAQVTFTAETWAHIQDVLEKDFPGKRIIGWYHTHPGFGIFLSEMDLFIHNNFFDGLEQLALVYDPISGEEGVFVWRAGLATREMSLIENDVKVDAAAVPTASAEAASVSAALSQELAERVESLEKHISQLYTSLFLVILLAILWPISWPILRGQLLGDSVSEAPEAPTSRSSETPRPRTPASVSKPTPRPDPQKPSNSTQTTSPASAAPTNKSETRPSSEKSSAKDSKPGDSAPKKEKASAGPASDPKAAAP
jgi:proteasome lid subunit RPN8/RPN11